MKKKIFNQIVDSWVICVGNINAFGFIKLKFGIEFTTGFTSSFNTVVEPGYRSIVLIGVDCCWTIGLSFRYIFGEDVVCSSLIDVEVCNGGT